MIRIDKKTFASTLLTASLLVSGNVMAHGDDCEHSRLGDVMHDMKDSLKAYKRAAKKSDWAAMGEARNTLVELSGSVYDEQPLKVKEVSAEERPELIKTYQMGMDRLSELFSQLEQAESAQDKAQVMALLKKLGAHSKKSHKATALDCD